MKKSLFLIFFISIWNFYFLIGQTPGEWTWMTGSNSNCTPIYGTQGVPSPLNTPGDMYEAACWTDNNGDFWLYGGWGDLTSALQPLQNMWKYNVANNMWTWMNGPGNVSSPFQIGIQGVFGNNVTPGSTLTGNHAEWVDNNGDLWLLTCDYGFGSCLWKYSIPLNQWAFIHGNIPENNGILGVPDPLVNPALWESPVSWVDNNNNLYLYYGVISTMYKYNISSNMWTRVNGNSVPITFSNIGTIGQYSSLNLPKSGFAYQHWESDDGTFYLFGSGGENKMWQFDPMINQWRVVHNGDLFNTSYFMSNCTFTDEIHPKGVDENRISWKDGCNRFYGLCHWYVDDVNEFSKYVIWCYDPFINQFALVDEFINQGLDYIPVATAQGMSSPVNSPGQWAGSPYWTDALGNFWKAGTNFEGSNSLWRYIPDYTCLGGTVSANFFSTPLSGCSPLMVNFLPQNTSNTITFDWNFGDTSTEFDTSSQVTPSYSFSNPGTYSVQLIMSEDFGCSFGIDTAEIQIDVFESPNLNLNNDTIICAGTSVLLSALGANSYAWSPSVGLNSAVNASVVATPLVTTNYLVAGTISGCTATDSVLIQVNPTPNVTLDNLIVLAFGDSTQLFASGGETYSWQPPTGLSCTDCPNPIVQPTVPTQYTVTVTDSNGCVNTKSVFVNIETDGCIYIPNIFSPNMDAQNDEFCLYGSCLKSGTFTIYNRWGEKVFETTDMKQCWDGTYKGVPVGSDVFFYKLNGVLVTGEVVEESGNIEVVR